MKTFLAWLKRWQLQTRLEVLQAEYNADREAFDWLCAKLSDDRRAIAAVECELDCLDGRHCQSVHQLRAR